MLFVSDGRAAAANCTVGYIQGGARTEVVEANRSQRETVFQFLVLTLSNWHYVTR